MMAQRPNACGAIVDIILVAAASGAAFAVELWARDAGLLNLGDDSKGLFGALAGAAAALILVFMRGQSLFDIGFRRPRRWLTAPIWIVGILFAYIAAQAALPALLAPYFTIPAPDLSRYDNIYDNLPAALTMAALLPLTASVPEEIIYRGFLIDRLTRIFGAGLAGAVMTVLVQSAFFGAVHFQWGLGGMAMTAIMGVVWGAAFLLCGRNLWIVILAHSGGHLLLVAQLYFVKGSEISAG